ncbi:MAG: arsenosugar biosynthesis radical SAM protein ArsS [Nitrospinota bacterium]|nr:arsenosugar biosynthesis radical SAM protein ArsS [Nitrospinota bacterium]
MTPAESFADALRREGLKLHRDRFSTLQVNVGYVCNQTCMHCHVEAGPDRKETMDRNTAERVVRFAAAARPDTADITGGATEMCDQLPYLVENLRPHVDRLMVRTNLTAAGGNATGERMAWFIDLLKGANVVVIASFPAPSKGLTDSQRGEGVFEKGVAALRALNKAGYGIAGSDLELNLVSNPAGAFLPSAQEKAKSKFRADMKRKYSVEFSNLFTFANTPLGRFRRWLADSGNKEDYFRKLRKGFNPCAVTGLMCRSLISVGWDGYLYDCDFNLAADLPLGGRKTHISEMNRPPQPGSPIAVGDHCFACAAGSGFT